MDESGGTNSRTKNGAQRLVDNPWVTLTERAAVYVLVVGLGIAVNMLTDLRAIIADPNDGMVLRMTEIRTVQDSAIVPALRAVEGDVSSIMHNLLNHPRFDKEDGQRLDAEHKQFMGRLDERLRELESTRAEHDHPLGGAR